MTSDPPGYRFCPTDEELISCYLKPNILGDKLPPNTINYRQLYGPNSTPWEVLDPIDHHSWIDSPNKPSEKTVYLFTTLSKISKTNSNTTRVRGRKNTCKKAGCGTWGGQTKKQIRNSDGYVIGERRLLVFEINDIGVQYDLSNAGYYKMHEYCLSGVNQGLESANILVLCKITFDSAKNPVFKLGAKTDYHVSKTTSTSKSELVMNSGGIDDNLEGRGSLKTDDHVSTTTSTSISESVMNDDNLEGSGSLAPENLVVIDSCGVADCLIDDYDWSVECNNGVQEVNEFGGDLSFDIDSFIRLLTSNQEEWPVEDTNTINKLGKRNFEAEENLCQTKKMCIR